MADHNAGSRVKKNGERRRWMPLWTELCLLLTVVVAAVWLLRMGYQRYMETAYPLEYTEYVEKYATEYGFEPSLIYAIVRTESKFFPESVSSAGAMGLMQLTEDTFEWAQRRSPESEKLTSEQLFDPETNIHYGVYVLQLLGEQFEEQETVLAAYNAGMGNVTKWLEDPAYSDNGTSLYNIPYPETENYVKKVISAKEMYRELYKME